MDEETQMLLKELKEQRALLDEHSQSIKKLRRSHLLGNIMGFIRLLIILIPFVIAAIYLPSFIEGAKGYINNVGNTSEDSSGVQIPQGLDLRGIEQFLER